MRQDNKGFVKLLNGVREGKVSERDIAALNDRCVVSAEHPLPSDGIIPTKLYCVNTDVDTENLQRLADLPAVECVNEARDYWKEPMPAGTLALVKKKMADSIDKETPKSVRNGMMMSTEGEKSEEETERKTIGHDPLVNYTAPPDLPSILGMQSFPHCAPSNTV